MIKNFGLATAVALATALVSGQASSVDDEYEHHPVVVGPVSDFREAITSAVLASPQVNASWYNFEATRESQRVAKGGYFPSVDLQAQIGREDRDTPLINPDPYTADAVAFSITQMLFDGFFTRDEVRRLGYAALSDYYTFQRDSEAIALEATQAYLDTVRFQQLVEMAKDNYVVHRQVYDMIAERTGSGVGQGVDLEQASARIALAESNLVTEMSNLYDVQTRFQRVIGALPGENLPLPQLSTAAIPSTRTDALRTAYQASPIVNSAIENLRSAQWALNSTDSPYWPRLDLRYRNQVEHDTGGIEGKYDEEAIELLLEYNLYRGGSDAARRRQFNNLYYSAMEERRQACLNVRQDVMIAYNDVEALEEQVVLLEKNMQSQDRTRRAYRDQFDLGQRTLLDLLDSQNEYFTTQRSVVDAQADLREAQGRTLAGMGLLNASLSFEGLNAERLEELDLDFSRDQDDENAKALCPIDVNEPAQIDREALFASLSGAGASYDSADYDNSGAALAASAVALGALTAGNDRYTEVGENMASIELNVLFEVNSSIISTLYDDEIANTARFLSENPSVTAIVEGHTDSTGEDHYNQWLSERRAVSVRDALIDRFGVSPDQLGALGYGESRPLDDNSTAYGRDQNRRVELIINANGY